MFYLIHFLRWWHRWRPCIVVLSADGAWTAYDMCGRCRVFTQSSRFNVMLVWHDGAPRAVSTINGERP